MRDPRERLRDVLEAIERDIPELKRHIEQLLGAHDELS